MTQPTSHKDLLSAYEKLLGSLNIVFDEKGNGVIGYSNTPAVIDNRILQLPTDDNLKKATWTTHIPFHPICESIVRKESAVIKKLRAWINLRMAIAIGDLLTHVATAAFNTSTHSGLSPECIKVLSLFPDASKQTAELLQKIIAMMDDSSGVRLVNFYLKVGGELNDIPYRRACIVSFPFAEEIQKAINENSDTIFGIKTTKKNIRSIHAMVTWLLGDEEYSRGSNSDVAPYFDALLKSYAALAGRIDAFANMWSSIIPKDAYCFTDVSWAPLFSDMRSMKNIIPSLKDNVGEIDEDNTNVASIKNKNTPAPAPVSTGNMPPPPTNLPMTAPGVINQPAIRKIGASVPERTSGGTSGGPSVSLNGKDDWSLTVQRNEMPYQAYAGFATRDGGYPPQGYPQQPVYNPNIAAPNPYGVQPQAYNPYGYPQVPQQQYPQYAVQTPQPYYQQPQGYPPQMPYGGYPQQPMQPTYPGYPQYPNQQQPQMMPNTAPFATR